MAERKKYVNVKIPILDEETRVLGTPKELDQKTIKLDLTRKLRGKGLTIKFRIFNKDEKLFAIPNKIELVKAYIRRVMRKRTDYVEDSFKAKCADIRVIIKPLLITRNRVSRAVKKNLRNTTKEYLLDYVKERDYNHICSEILDGTLQKSMLPKLKKVYPLSFCDIRIFETKEIQKIDLAKIIPQEKPEEIVDEESSAADEEEELKEQPKDKSEEKKAKKKAVKKEEEIEEIEND